MLEIKKSVLSRIVNGIFENGYTDSHDGNHISPSVVVLRLIDGNIDICAAFEKVQYFCINPFVEGINDDKIYLSQMSIGGVVDLRYVSNLDEAVAEYNNRHKDEELVIIRKNDINKALEIIEAA